jgi:hypothetical protein
MMPPVGNTFGKRYGSGGEDLLNWGKREAWRLNVKEPINREGAA